MLYSGLVVDNTYQIVEEIGSGGMGVVYLAYHLRLQKYVVMKKIKDVSADIAMLRNEVDILKELHHPYLPQVYDFIMYENDLYTIIDYVDGHDLKFYIDNGYVFSEGQLIKWLKQLCEVLSYLHTHNPQVLHTDIKPANIIVKNNGDICLIDFGISLFGAEQIKGISADYSSPEQYYNVEYIRNGQREYCVALDERVDIYSLGATFYHLMTGIKPSLLEAQPRVSSYNYGYSEIFSQIIDRCKETDRNQRYYTADDVLRAVENMYKLDNRYKKYLLIQVASSVLAGIMIVSGAIMTITGYRNNVVSDFESRYSEFLNISESGDVNSAVELGYSLINDKSYKTYMDSQMRSHILHAIGDCYYDSGDYYNAAHNYQLAINESDNEDDIVLFYRDYLFALINDGKINEANNVLQEVSARYPQSSVISLVKAQTQYKNGQYNEAISTIDSVISQLSSDTDNLYTAYLIKGDSYDKLSQYSKAVESYENAVSVKETARSLRKLGNASLKYASNQSNKQQYVAAMESFEKINSTYTASVDDVINLAQCYLLCEGIDNYNKCISLLEDYLTVYGDDCRVYIMLAIASDAASGNKTQEYCLKANNLYKQLSAEDKSKIDIESMNRIKELYRIYCGGAW